MLLYVVFTHVFNYYNNTHTQQNCNCNSLWCWLCENTKHFPISNCFDSHVKQQHFEALGCILVRRRRTKQAQQESRLQLVVLHINIYQYIYLFVHIYLYIKGNFRYLPSLLRNWLWKSPYSPKNELRSRKQTSVLAENTRTKILRRIPTQNQTQLLYIYIHSTYIYMQLLPLKLSKTPLLLQYVCSTVLLIPFLQLVHNFQMTFN